MPNEKSSSSVSSNRFFCESVSTLYARPLVSEGPSGGRSSVCSLPCTRICGGVCVVMCRSDPLTCTSVCNSSGNVAICQLPISSYQLPVHLSGVSMHGTCAFPVAVRTDWKLATFHLLDRLPRDFLNRRDAFHHLVESAAAEGNHPFLDRLAAQFQP